MKRMLAICMSTALFLTACSQRPVLKIAEQGSFAIGGKVLTDSLGHTYHGDHAYVQFWLPAVRRGTWFYRILFCTADRDLAWY